MRLATRLGFALLLGGLAAAATACAHAPTAPPARTVRLAVLDGSMAGGSGETRRSIAGWWMGARDRFDDGNAGIHLADLLSTEFEKVPGVEVHSRTDIRAMMAEKEHILRSTYPDLSPEERYRVLMDQQPVDYGRSLGVDFVLAPDVTMSRLVHQRTFHWWYSKAAASVELWDVSRGEKVWQWSDRDSALFASQKAALEDLAQSARKDAEKENAFGLAP